MDEFIITLAGMLAIAIILNRIKRLFKDGSCGSCLQDCSSCQNSKEGKSIEFVLDKNGI